MIDFNPYTTNRSTVLVSINEEGPTSLDLLASVTVPPRQALIGPGLALELNEKKGH